MRALLALTLSLAACAKSTPLDSAPSLDSGAPIDSAEPDDTGITEDSAPDDTGAADDSGATDDSGAADDSATDTADDTAAKDKAELIFVLDISLGMRETFASVVAGLQSATEGRLAQDPALTVGLSVFVLEASWFEEPGAVDDPEALFEVWSTDLSACNSTSTLAQFLYGGAYYNNAPTMPDCSAPAPPNDLPAQAGFGGQAPGAGLALAAASAPPGGRVVLITNTAGQGLYQEVSGYEALADTEAIRAASVASADRLAELGVDLHVVALPNPRGDGYAELLALPRGAGELWEPEGDAEVEAAILTAAGL